MVNNPVLGANDPESSYREDHQKRLGAAAEDLALGLVAGGGRVGFDAAATGDADAASSDGRRTRGSRRAQLARTPT
jgi:hypothetical protein